MSTASQIETRVLALDESLEYSYSEIFQIVCREFGLDAALYEAVLGCRCPFGLVGYLKAEE